MYVRVSTAIGSVQSDEGLSSFALLPLLQTTNVRVEAVGSDFLLFLNNTLDSQVTIKGKRQSGDATIYVSNPWNTPALANIGSIQMKPISTSSTLGVMRTLYEQSTISANSIGLRAVIPYDYSLVFDITPIRISPQVTNVFVYSRSGFYLRMPGIFGLK